MPSKWKTAFQVKVYLLLESTSATKRKERSNWGAAGGVFATSQFFEGDRQGWASCAGTQWPEPSRRSKGATMLILARCSLRVSWLKGGVWRIPLFWGLYDPIWLKQETQRDTSHCGHGEGEVASLRWWTMQTTPSTGAQLPCTMLLINQRAACLCCWRTRSQRPNLAFGPPHLLRHLSTYCPWWMSCYSHSL